MKILLGHKCFRERGGSELFMFETGRILESQGHQVAYFSTIDEKNRSSAYAQYFVKPPDFRSPNLFIKFWSLKNIIYSREARKNMARLLRDFQPEVVHIFSVYTQLSFSILDACRDAGVPVVMSLNDYKHICPNQKMYHHGRICRDCQGGRFYKAVVNRCCQNSRSFSLASCLEAYTQKWMNSWRKNTRKFLFASDFMARITEEFWGKDTFQWAKLANPFNAPAHKFSPEFGDYFLFFGRLVEEKGLTILLEAMKKLPDGRLIIVGEGPQEPELKALAQKLNLTNVEFVGPRWGPALEKILKKARFTVSPSIWPENIPYAILQSFASGKAVVGSNLGGIPELVADGQRGRLYPAMDSAALAGVLGDLWRNPARAQEMGQNAKNFVDREFNDDKFYGNLMEIYRSVLK